MHRCKSCHGKKLVMSIGYQLKKCAGCGGVGYVKEEKSIRDVGSDVHSAEENEHERETSSSKDDSEKRPAVSASDEKGDAKSSTERLDKRDVFKHKSKLKRGRHG
jgi:hypothetical protein